MTEHSTKIEPLSEVQIEDAENKIQKVVEACDVIKLSEMTAIKQAVTLAKGLQALRNVFTPQLVNTVFMPLQGTTLGFLTDKDNEQGYNDITVRACWIQGCLWGLHPINNEMNIIAAKPYAAKNGLERKVREATRGLIIRPGVPIVAQGLDKTALVPMRAEWMIGDKRQTLVKDLGSIDGKPFDERYAIRVNNGMGPDAIIGKAFRKVYRDILAMIVNGVIKYEDGDVTDTTGEVMTAEPVAPPERDGQRTRLTPKVPRDRDSASVAPMREPGED